MDYYPNQLIHMVRLGLRERALQSKTIWLCVSCLTCVARCPNQIDIVRFMDILRQESFKEGLSSPMEVVPQFHRVFMNEIQKKGRISELALLIHFKMKTWNLVSFKKSREEVTLAIKMFSKGKLKLLSPFKTRQKEVEDIFRRALLDKQSSKKASEGSSR